MISRRIVSIILLCITLSLFLVFSCFAEANDPSIQSDICKNCTEIQNNCNTNGTSTSPGTKTLILLGLIGLISAYTWVQYKKVLYLVIGIATCSLIGFSYVYSNTNRKTSTVSCNIKGKLVTDSIKPASADEFRPVTDEFASASAATAIDSNEKSNDLSDFAPATSELIPAAKSETVVDTFDSGLLYQIIGLFLLIVLIGITLKYAFVRRLRGFVLLSSVVYLGFVKGACPCMIMSLQNTILFVLGNSVKWLSMLWFLGLIPLTYFFGKVWCGWLCHLGGLQDFIFRSTGLHWLTSQKAQKILKQVQMALFVTLLVQLIITRTNIYVHYDPFKVAFNLISANMVGYGLLVLLLVSSIFIYRPFCRIACPVGLILGWVVLIPGARKLHVAESSCNGCRTCTRQCKQYALHGSVSPIRINHSDCILCGECLGHCKKKSLSVSRK